MIDQKDFDIQVNEGILNTRDFTGTTQWYRFSPLTRAVLTDGTKYVAEKTDNYGLMQDIAIDCMRPKIKKALNEGLIVVKIDTIIGKIIYKDGNYKELLSYDLINYSPLKIDIFVSWIEENTPCLYLPSEH